MERLPTANRARGWSLRITGLVRKIAKQFCAAAFTVLVSRSLRTKGLVAKLRTQFCCSPMRPGWPANLRSANSPAARRNGFRGRDSARYNPYLSESDRLRAHCSGKPTGFALAGRDFALAKSLLALASWANPRTWCGKPGFLRSGNLRRKFPDRKKCA
jgi:hypothetical protein